MNKNNEFDKLIEASLKKNLNQVNFSDDMEKDVLRQTVQKKSKILYRLKALLNYEFEIPVAYAAVFGFVLIGLFSSHLTGYFPGPEDISSYQLEWINIDYKGVI